ncbi:PadR family transcriptional regulator [Amycolatopsis vastitatis]|uniref:PadR family transcriptional regulator n=1 Tax=Amycolatopsis vastitatis TaxID=1905142 RepID=A0A229SQ47_9PSEU|nr:PadR family transcriptional regulator [Amycolatopsis vastitatis]OXM60978.1 PadR family transcriptional regulator [Amycolatopsis vastitatis]
MKLENLLLGVLLQRPSTGYDLKKYLDTFGRFLRSNTQMSQVYRSLGRMETDGWVSHSVEPRPGAQDAKLYAVTAEGATVFLDWLKGPYAPPTRFQEPEFGVRLSFAGFMTVEEVIELLETEITTRREQIARYRFRDRKLPRDPALPFDDALADLVGEWEHQAGAAAIDAHVVACEALRQRLLDGEAIPVSEVDAHRHA